MEKSPSDHFTSRELWDKTDDNYYPAPSPFITSIEQNTKNRILVAPKIKKSMYILTPFKNLLDKSK
jgi:hypothetical protein